MLLLTLAAIAPIGAFLTIALIALHGTIPSDRPKILRELAAMIAWRSGEPPTSPQQLQITRRINR